MMNHLPQNRFQPSSYSLSNPSGDAPSSDTPSGKGARTLEQYAPAISSLIFGGDPREKLAKKTASLANFRALYKGTASGFLRKVYANKIRTLQQEVQALQEIAGEERSAVMVTQGAKFGGIFLLVAGGTALLMAGNFFRQKARVAQAKAKRIEKG